MNLKSRVLSLFVAIMMIVTALPFTVLQVSATADYSECSFDPQTTCVYGETFKFSGKITSKYIIKKVTIGLYNSKNGGDGIWHYTNPSVNAYSFSLSNVPSFTVGEVLTSVSGSDAELDTANIVGIDIIIYVVTEAADEAQKFEYEVTLDDLDTPTISSPDEDESFFSDDSITFRWNSVTGATGYEWEFYEGASSSGKLLDSGYTGISLSSRKVIIDSDVLKPGNDYCFYVRATNEYSDSSWERFKVHVESSQQPEVTNLSVPSTTVSVGEEFVITVKTNTDAYGVAFYVKDSDSEIYHIGNIDSYSSSTSTSKTFKFNYYFNKTNKYDDYGADIQNTRTLYAYPIDINGNVVKDDSVCKYVSMTVNPAEGSFSEFKVNTPVKVTLGKSAVISWESTVSSNNSTPTYNVYIDNEYYDSTTKTSYTLPESFITELGVGNHSITIQATAPGHRAKQSSNFGALIIQEPEQIPEVTNLSVPSTTVSVGEEFVITVKTNTDAYGVAFYVKDSDSEIYHIGNIESYSSSTSTSKTFKFNYFFNKTNKTDASGADIQNTRTLYAYPIDINGNVVKDDSVCKYVSMEIKPAKEYFSEYIVNTPVKVTLGKSAVISWESTVSSNNSTPTYNVYIDNEYYDSTTKTSYTLPESFITELGVGNHSITIQATAPGHRAKQSSNFGALIIGYTTSTRGDINGDGVVTNLDRFLLSRYLAGVAGYTEIDKTIADINGDNNINESDLEYLTRHLAGWVGYEKLPEIPSANECSHANHYHAYSGKTIWINNTIKTSTHHTCYHIYNVFCKNTDCGELLGQIQGELIEQKHVYNVEGVCPCGAINTSGYTKWDGINITNKRVPVYPTPYSTDATYGQLFANEEVVVLGYACGRYLVEYTVTSTGQRKQGYVNTNTIGSNETYKILFDYESVTLSVTGKEILLVPYGTTASFVIVDKRGNEIPLTSLKDFRIESNNLLCNGNNLTGKTAGISYLAAYFTDAAGKTIRFSLPSLCAVVGSQQDGIYFSSGEADTIQLAIDWFYSSNIPLPAMTDWTTWDNFLLNIENLKDNIVGVLGGIVTGTTINERATAAIIAEYIDYYISEVNNGSSGLSNEACEWSAVFSALVNDIAEFKKLNDFIGLPGDVADAIETVVNLKNGIKDAKSFKAGLNAVMFLIDQDSVQFKALELLKQNGMTLKKFKSSLSGIIKSDFLSSPIDYVGLGLDVASTGFEVLAHITADYEANKKVLENIKVGLDSSVKEDKLLLAAINILEDEYCNKFKTSCGKIINGALGIAVDQFIGMCPAASVLLSVAEAAIKQTTVKEESELIYFSYFAYQYLMSADFSKDVWSNGEITVSYATACENIRMSLYIGKFYNKLATKVKEPKTLNQEEIRNNIAQIDKLIAKFECYFATK